MGLGLLRMGQRLSEGINKSTGMIWQLKAQEDRDQRLAELERERDQSKHQRAVDIKKWERDNPTALEQAQSDYYQSKTAETKFIKLGSDALYNIETEQVIRPSGAVETEPTFWVENPDKWENGYRQLVSQNLTGDSGSYMNWGQNDRERQERLIGAGVELRAQHPEYSPQEIFRQITTQGGMGSRAPQSSYRTIRPGSFEPDEVDTGSEWLGMEYGSDEIDAMVSEATARVESGSYKTRMELAQALEGNVTPSVLLQILDRVFPEGGLLQSGGKRGEENVSSAVGSVPPLDRLSEGKQRKFANGQVWTLRNGKAVRIQ